MQVQLNKPELEKFIGEQVKSGNFPSADAAVEAAIERMRVESELGDLDDETAAAINRAEEQLDRGEGIELLSANQFFGRHSDIAGDLPQ